MSWKCPRCLAELGDYNAYCEYCKSNNIIVYNPDRYYIRDIRIYHLSEEVKDKMDNEKSELTGEELIMSIESNARMTPQEKLHAILFYHEKVFVKDMDILQLRAHREELAKIAFEARARLTAVDDEEEDRKRKKNNKDKSPSGFERSLNTDETTTSAINAIKDRQKRLTKTERIQEGLKKLYELAGSTDGAKEAARVTSATAIIAEVQRKAEEKKVSLEPAKPIFNPFAKKEL